MIRVKTEQNGRTNNHSKVQGDKKLKGQVQKDKRENKQSKQGIKRQK